MKYLVPLRLLEGHAASPQILQKYSLESQYGQIIDAFKCGRLGDLRAAIEARQAAFIRQGIFLVLEKVQM